MYRIFRRVSLRLASIFHPRPYLWPIIKIIIFTKNLRPCNYNCQLRRQPREDAGGPWSSGLLLIKHNFCVNKSECNLRTKSMSGFICCPTAERSLYRAKGAFYYPLFWPTGDENIFSLAAHKGVLKVFLITYFETSRNITSWLQLLKYQNYLRLEE